MVVTRTIRNRFVLNRARGFESHHLRQGSLEAFAPKEFFFLAERQTNCRSTGLFTLAIYMAIDICSGEYQLSAHVESSKHFLTGRGCLSISL